MRSYAYYIVIFLIVVMIGGVIVSKTRTNGSNQTDQGAEVVFADVSSKDADQLMQTHAGNPDFLILDVRTSEEYMAGYIEGALLLDYYAADFAEKLTQLDRSKTYLVYCRSGNRSGRTLQMMKDAGFRKVYNLQGGIISWQHAGLPLVR